MSSQKSSQSEKSVICGLAGKGLGIIKYATFHSLPSSRRAKHQLRGRRLGEYVICYVTYTYDALRCLYQRVTRDRHHPCSLQVVSNDCLLVPQGNGHCGARESLPLRRQSLS